MISVKTLTINSLRDMEIIIPPLAFKQTKEEEKEKENVHLSLSQRYHILTLNPSQISRNAYIIHIFTVHPEPHMVLFKLYEKD